MYEYTIDKKVKIVYGDDIKTFVRRCLVLNYNSDLKTLLIRDSDSAKEIFVNASEIKYLEVIDHD